VNQLTIERLRALPTDIIKVAGGAVLRRDCMVLRVHGEGVETILDVLFGLVGEGGATRAELISALASNFPGIEEAAERLLVSLIDCRILVEDGAEADSGGVETPAEIFFWNFDPSWDKATSALSRQYILLLGVNSVSRSIARALSDCGTENYDVADRASLRGQGFFGDAGELIAGKWSAGLKQPLDAVAMEDIDMSAVACMVATTDTGAQHLLRPLNRYAVNNKIPFLPVVLRDHVGQIGPLVIPGETACLECLRARQNANLADPETYRTAEAASEAGTWIVGHHPAMSAMIGDVVAMELSKQFVTRLPHRNVGTLIEIKLLEPSIARRKVLKVPRCVACGTSNTVSTANLDKKEYIPDPPPTS
jgi:bacteriocin biosynthesis cyclodehydratase domain-containing protein